MLTGIIIFVAGLVCGWCFLEKPQWACEITEKIRNWIISFIH